MGLLDLFHSLSRPAPLSCAWDEVSVSHIVIATTEKRNDRMTVAKSAIVGKLHTTDDGNERRKNICGVRQDQIVHGSSEYQSTKQKEMANQSRVRNENDGSGS